MFKRLDLQKDMANLSTIHFKSVITTLPVTQVRDSEGINSFLLVENTENTTLHLLAKKYTEQTGMSITKDYKLLIFHIDEILKWEETKASLGPFFTSLIAEGKGDPLRHIAHLMFTGRVNKNIVVIEVDKLNKVNIIENATLRTAINSETIFINHS